jgi:hypothetical protein
MQAAKEGPNPRRSSENRTEETTPLLEGSVVVLQLFSLLLQVLHKEIVTDYKSHRLFLFYGTENDLLHAVHKLTP